MNPLLPTMHDASNLPVETTVDVLVIGAGIAGLSFTLSLPDHLSVVLITKGSLGESNTWYAQGGLAAAVGPDDDPDLHLQDTLIAGAGLCDEPAVRELVEGGPAAVAWLIEQGTRFDMEQRHLALGKEAAHSRNRVIHAGGDATGAEIEHSLVAQIKARPSVRVLDHTSALDLVLDAEGRCAGAIVVQGDSGTPFIVRAGHTVLANGGAGRLWSVTSNPPGATGDGIAMALRAGAPLADLEFTQFHPTVLAGPGIEPFLITEAIRGEGAYLRASNGERFMVDIDERAELAPRDVVARAIEARMAADGLPVYLDLRHLDPAMVRSRFPTILDRLDREGISLTGDLIPVAPAAHYFMGGIAARSNGTTGMSGLYAIGEVSCTGVHGANRLASNSLLEGLVFGLKAAHELSGSAIDGGTGPLETPFRTCSEPFLTNGPDLRTRIQEIMSSSVAVVRSATGLEQARTAFESLAPEVSRLDPVHDVEIRNLLLLASVVTRSAFLREESRGGHFRSDFPETDPSLEGQHQRVVADDGDIVHSFGSLLP